MRWAGRLGAIFGGRVALGAWRDTKITVGHAAVQQNCARKGCRKENGGTREEEGAAVSLGTWSRGRRSDPGASFPRLSPVVWGAAASGRRMMPPLVTDASGRRREAPDLGIPGRLAPVCCGQGHVADFRAGQADVCEFAITQARKRIDRLAVAALRGEVGGEPADSLGDLLGHAGAGLDEGSVGRHDRLGFVAAPVSALTWHQHSQMLHLHNREKGIPAMHVSHGPP